MKPVDYTEFQKIKEMRGGNNDKIDNFKIDILEECALDIALTAPEKFRQKKLEKNYEVIDDGYFKQSDVDFPKYFLLKMQKKVQCFSFYS